MDEKVLHEAVENISLIKGVIDRTSKSFTACSKIFICWGALFILNSIITLLMIMNKEQMMDIAMQYPVFHYIFPVGIIALLAAVIYRNISKKIPVVGLERHVMVVWFLILVLNVIPARINIHSASTSIDMNKITVETSHFSIMFFSLAIALIVTSLFTGYKQPKYVGMIYIGMSVLYAYFNLPIFSGTLTQFFSLVSLPFTFLYLGFFLKSQQRRGESCGR